MTDNDKIDALYEKMNTLHQAYSSLLENYRKESDPVNKSEIYLHLNVAHSQWLNSIEVFRKFVAKMRNQGKD